MSVCMGGGGGLLGAHSTRAQYNSLQREGTDVVAACWACGVCTFATLPQRSSCARTQPAHRPARAHAGGRGAVAAAPRPAAVCARHRGGHDHVHRAQGACRGRGGAGAGRARCRQVDRAQCRRPQVRVWREPCWAWARRELNALQGVALGMRRDASGGHDRHGRGPGGHGQHPPPPTPTPA